MKKSFKLTLSEYSEAFGLDKFKPNRTIAPALITLGLGVALLVLLVLPYLEANPYKIKELKMVFLACAVITGIGLILWKREGQSVTAKHNKFIEHHSSKYLETMEFDIEPTGWTMCHQDGSSESRKFQEFYKLQETTLTFLLITNVIHVLPKRIFTTEEIKEFRKLTMAIIDGQDYRREIQADTLDFCMSIVDQLIWKHKVLLAGYLFIPLFIPLMFTNKQFNLVTGLDDSTINWKAVIIASFIWYAAGAIYVVIDAFIAKSRIQLRHINQSGFSFDYKSRFGFMTWTDLYALRESRACFSLESPVGQITTFHKNLLSKDEIALIREKAK